MRTATIARPSRCVGAVFACLAFCAIGERATILAAAPEAAVVGRITGMVDCRWADPASDGYSEIPRVRLGKKYALVSGFLEITYNTGARVILHGPCTYEVESRTGGYLSLGKLAVKVEKKAGKRARGNAGLFCIRTPAATIANPGADVGMEFGISVEKSGTSRIQVFRGPVDLRPIGGKEDAKAVRLENNESARVDIGKDRGATVVLDAGKSAGFPREMPISPAFPPKDKDGFTSMFNGKNLTGWEGEPGYWSVEDGAITGTTTTAKPLDHPSYLFWKDGQPADFELRASFRFVTPDGNSGINFRSQRLPKWDVKGYQADMETGPSYTGILYECNQREIVALRGQKVAIDENGHRTVTAVADAAKLQKSIKARDWNEYTIVARGPEIVFTINGVEMCRVIDKQKGKAAAKGCITLQIHPGPAMKVQFKNIRIKNL
jgi:hypothetical protein